MEVDRLLVRGCRSENRRPPVGERVVTAEGSPPSRIRRDRAGWVNCGSRDQHLRRPSAGKLLKTALKSGRTNHQGLKSQCFGDERIVVLLAKFQVQPEIFRSDMHFRVEPYPSASRKTSKTSPNVHKICESSVARVKTSSSCRSARTSNASGHQTMRTEPAVQSESGFQAWPSGTASACARAARMPEISEAGVVEILMVRGAPSISLPKPAGEGRMGGCRRGGSSPPRSECRCGASRRGIRFFHPCG